MNNNLEKYWSGANPCFVEVPNESQADKIHYYCGDHSAVKSSVSGKYESKWGSNFLVRHYPTIVPSEYKSSYRKYYKRTPSSISGSNEVCYSGSSFILNNPPSGMVYWTVTGSFSFSSSSNVTSITSVQPTVYRTIGSPVAGTLTAYLGNASGPVLATKSISACITSITGPDAILTGGTGQYNLINPPVATTIYWSVSNTALFSVVSSNCPTTVTKIGSGTGSVTLSAHVGSTSGTVIATKTITAPSPPVISGYTLICSSASKQFSATNWYGYTWNKSSNLTLSSTTTNPVTVTYNGSGAGWVSVNNGNVELARYDVWVGVPSISYISGPTSVSQGSYNTYQAIYNTLAAPTSFYWTLNQSGVGYSYQTTVSPYAGFSFYSTGGYQVICQATNACGQGGSTGIGVYVGRGGSSNYIVYPNPVSNILYIELNPPANLKAPPTYDLRLYDGQGNLLQQRSANGGTVQFNVSALPDNIYYLHIFDGVNSTPEIHQIVVEH